MSVRRLLSRLGDVLARPSRRDQRLFELAERMGTECRELRQRLDRVEATVRRLDDSPPAGTPGGQ